MDGGVDEIVDFAVGVGDGAGFAEGVDCAAVLGEGYEVSWCGSHFGGVCEGWCFGKGSCSWCEW